jgi:hypothetical protein
MEARMTVVHWLPKSPSHTDPALEQNLVADDESAAARPLEVVVVNTDARPTMQALRSAYAFARNLKARIRVVVPHVVPYQLPLDAPPVERGVMERRMRALLPDAAGDPIETRIEILLCRDVEIALRGALAPGSTVIVGGRYSWWPNAADRLAWRLRRMGHQVVRVNSK